MHLKCIIESSDKDEFIAQDSCVGWEFIEAALYAAKHSKSSARDYILEDIGAVIGCEAKELRFLFHSETYNQNDNTKILELPDQRFVSGELISLVAE